MWRILVIAALVAVSACSTSRAVKIRCDRHLVRINVLPPDHLSPRSPSAGGDNR